MVLMQEKATAPEDEHQKKKLDFEFERMLLLLKNEYQNMSSDSKLDSKNQDSNTDSFLKLEQMANEEKQESPAKR